MATGKISKVYQHWADEVGAWNNNILSANKSEYSEGEVIPHVFVFKASNQAPLVNGQEYTFTITYNFYQANTNAGGFAFITDFNTSRTPGSLPGASPGQDPVIDSTFANGGGIQGSFYTVDADITEVSDVTFTGTGTKDGQVTVTFIYTGPTTTNGIAEIYYGLQIAAPGDVPDQGSGPTNGASAWTGGSLQTTVDIGGSGATSIQLSPAAIVVPDDPAIEIVKTGTFNDANGDGNADVGETITYAFAVSNIGNVTLNGVTVTDPKVTVVGGPTTLDVGETDTTTFTGSYVVTQADIDAGQVDNLALATGTSPAGDNVTDDDDETVPLAQVPGIALVKTGAFNDENGDGNADAGETITYAFAVSNTGNVTLNGVTVTDPLVTVVGGPTTLDVNETDTTTFTGSYVVTQADIDAGQVDNLALATGSPPAGDNVTDDDDETVPLAQVPGIDLIKTGTFNDENGDGNADLGETITYAFAVSNTGNVTLTNVTVTDPKVTVVGGPTTLDVGETDTTTFTGSYVVTQADIDAGQVDNLALATGSPPAGGDVTDDDDETVDLGQDPGIALVKTGTFNDENGDGDADVGETITYAFAVSNTGNVTLTNVTVTDPKVTVVGGPTTLDVGETDTTTFTGTYVLTQEDIDAEQVDNLATADSDESDPASDDETVPLDDDAPVVGELGVFVDEDFLAAGNQDLPSPSPGDDGGSDSVTDDFPIDFESDFDGATISFAALDGQAVTDTSSNAVMTSDGNLPLTYVWDGATNTLYGSTDPTDAAATAAFTLQVTNPGIGNESGSFVFTLQQALEHGQGVTPNTENPNIDLALGYVATDVDGDEALGTLGITIDDDIPIRAADATPIAATVLEDGMSIVGGDPGGLNGADQSEGNKESGETNDDDQKSSLVAGSLAALVAVGADAPAAFGLDSDTSALPELFSKGDAVTYATSDENLDGTLDTLVATADGRTVFTLVVNPDGTWEFDLDDQLDHVDDGADDENVDLVTTGTSVPAIDFSSIIQVTDADGDTVNVLVADDFTIAVEDDIPELTGAEDLSVENVVGSAGTASGQATFSVGADEAVSFIITEATGEEGVDYTISLDGKTVTGHMDLDGDGTIEPGEDLYTFTIDDTGAYTFELLAELPPPDPVVFSAAGIASGDYPDLTLSNSGLQLVIDAETAAGADTTLQVSQASGGGIGVVQNTIENEESVTFSFEDSGGNEVAASQFTVTIKDDAGNPDYVWSAILEDGTVVALLDDGGANNPGGADVTYTAVGSGDLIATVELASGERFTDIQLQVVGNQNDKAKLGLEGFSFTPDTPDVNLAFDIEATDADGDTATLQLADSDTDGDLDSLQVHIEADGDPTTLLADAAMQTYLQSLSSSV
ncbi:DUF7507 domain-containing protein [Taklimakanibacter deserti]|uniref:DUF7507 domain-containing protein n=1 Tax=Taklimakanibacter deserti TaxID=2267839 RepID=UPI000E64C479